jgi:hypothetical protein
MGELSVVEVLDKSIEKYSSRKELQNLTDNALKLTVSGPKDEAGYKVAKEALGVMVKARTSQDKVRAEIKAPALAFGKKVDAEYKEREAILSPGESHLKEQCAIVEEYEKKRAEEAERKRLERIYERKKLIFSFNPVVTETGFVVSDVLVTMTDIDDAEDVFFNGLAEKMRLAAIDKKEKDAELAAKLARLEELEKKDSAQPEVIASTGGGIVDAYPKQETVVSTASRTYPVTPSEAFVEVFDVSNLDTRGKIVDMLATICRSLGSRGYISSSSGKAIVYDEAFIALRKMARLQD